MGAKLGVKLGSRIDCVGKFLIFMGFTAGVNLTVCGQAFAGRVVIARFSRAAKS
jgi:hypothetical protein